MKALYEPALAHRFVVSFFINNIPSPVDFQFQRISGLQRQIDVSSLRQGGDNLGSVHLPERITHGNLVLERGVTTITPLTLAFNEAMTSFHMRYMTVIVMLMNHLQIPVCSWTFVNALPVNWQTGDLDASSSTVLINTLELAYEKMHWLGVKA